MSPNQNQLVINNPDSRTKHLLTQVGQRKPYWLMVDCNQTGVVNESTMGNSRSTDHELIIRGAITDRTLTRIRILDTNSGFAFSSDPVPIQAVAGKQNLTSPIVQWFTPYLLSPRTQLRCEFLNDGTTPDATGGWIIFLCEY